MDPMYLVTGALGVGQSLLNYNAQRSANAQNYAIMKMQNEYNMNMLDQQYQNNVKLWQMNNNYNTPAKQMERLRSAGLNPSLLMGNNATAPAQAATAPSAAPAAGAVMQPAMFQFSDVFKNVADSLKSISETKGQNINNSYLDERNRSEIQKNFSYAVNQLQESRNHPVQRAYWESVCKNLALEYKFNEQSFNVRYRGLELQNQMMDAQKELVGEQSMNYHLMNQYQNIQNQMAAMQLRVEPERLQAVLSSIWSQAEAQHSAAGMYDNQALKAKCEARGLYLNNKQFEAIAPYLKKVAEFGAQSSEYEAKQKKLDYSNPLRYIFGGGSGAGFSALGAAAMKLL